MLTPYTKINSKWFTDLNVSLENIKLLKEITGSNLLDMGFSNIFKDMSPQARETKATINYRNYTKIKSFCAARETISKTKRQPTKWKKIFTNEISDKEVIFKMHKRLIQLATKKSQIIPSKWTEDLNRHFSKEDIQMANRHMRRCSASLLIREMQIRTTVRSHLIPVRMARIRMTKIGEDVEKKEPLHTVGGRVNCCNHWKILWRFLKKLKIEQLYDLAIPLLGIYAKKMKISGHLCGSVSQASAFASGHDPRVLG